MLPAAGSWKSCFIQHYTVALRYIFTLDAVSPVACSTMLTDSYHKEPAGCCCCRDNPWDPISFTVNTISC